METKHTLQTKSARRTVQVRKMERERSWDHEKEKKAKENACAGEEQRVSIHVKKRKQ